MHEPLVILVIHDCARSHKSVRLKIVYGFTYKTYGFTVSPVLTELNTVSCGRDSCLGAGCTDVR